MKKKVYCVMSLKQNNFIVFGTRKRAEEYIEEYEKEVFDKSEKVDLYVTKRIVF